MENKVIQIIPAPNYHAVFANNDGSVFADPVVCIGLFSDGDMLLFTIGGDGMIQNLDGEKNFLGYETKDKLYDSDGYRTNHFKKWEEQAQQRKNTK